MRVGGRDRQGLCKQKPPPLPPSHRCSRAGSGCCCSPCSRWSLVQGTLVFHIVSTSAPLPAWRTQNLWSGSGSVWDLHQKRQRGLPWGNLGGLTGGSQASSPCRSGPGSGGTQRRGQSVRRRSGSAPRWEEKQSAPMLGRELNPNAAISTSTRTKYVNAMNLLEGFFKGRLFRIYLGTYLKRPIFLKCENISPPGTYSSIMYRLELSCNDMYCLVSCFLSRTMFQYWTGFSSYAYLYKYVFQLSS